MKEKIHTLNIRQTGIYQYEVSVPETGATKTAPRFCSTLTITLHDILKQLMISSLILMFADQHVDKDDRSVDPQERLQSGLEHEAALEVAQLGIASQLKRRERHRVFELSRPLTRVQATWFDEHVRKLFDRYHMKDELEVQLDTLLGEVRDHMKVAAHE